MENEFNTYFTLVILGLIVVFLLWDRFKPSVVFFTGVLILLAAGILPIENFLRGFSNQSIIMIFLLILGTALLSKTYNLVKHLDSLFGSAKSIRSLILRMGLSVGPVSAVMNNTPVVALMIPYLYRWSTENDKSPSKTLIPLSYAAILGGMMTPIGTSTNLILIGFIATTAHPNLEFIHFLIPGTIVFLICLVALVLISPPLLPEHKDPVKETVENLRNYLTETVITSDSEWIGKTIAEANLRNLDGIFLVKIHRENDEVIRPVNPDAVLQKKDRLYFAGETSGVIKLVDDNPNLTWRKDHAFDLDEKIDLVEVVIPSNSGLEGKTLKQVNFRDAYDAAVIGIHRKSSRLFGKLGEIPLAAGDLLLLTTGSNFERLSTKDNEFYTVSMIEKEDTPPFWKKVSLGVVTLGALAATFAGYISLFIGLLIILSTGVVLNLMTEEEAKKNTSMDLFVILGSALTLGVLFIDTGGADLITAPLTYYLEGAPPILILGTIFAATLIFTSFITNAAAISIMFPLVYQLIENLQLNPLPVYLVLAFGASAAFITPVGYQTNLMVMGPGNYTTRDFLKIGIPFTFVYTFVVIAFMLTFYTIYV